MPIYEYRCRACGTTIEELRSAGEADEPLPCACGQADTARLPSLIARGQGGGELPMAGGCCGGSCACGH